jgi:hypothetical protein
MAAETLRLAGHIDAATRLEHATGIVFLIATVGTTIMGLAFYEFGGN